MRCLYRLVRAGLMASCFATGGMTARAEMVEGEGDILWTEDFKDVQHDFNGEKGWRIRDGTPKIHVTLADGKARLSNASDTVNPNCLGRYVPLFPGRTSGDYIYAQLQVTEVSDKQMMWSVSGTGMDFVPGEHPGTWTVPYVYLPNGVKKADYLTIYLYGAPSSYMEIEWLRLVCGLPRGTVVWKRNNNPPWDEDLQNGEKLTIMANVGVQKTPPRLSFWRVSFNCYQPLGGEEIKLRDDGKEGDEKANDGIWSVTASLPPLGAIVLDNQTARRVLVARIRYGEDQDVYGFSPWPIPAK